MDEAYVVGGGEGLTERDTHWEQLRSQLAVQQLRDALRPDREVSMVSIVRERIMRDYDVPEMELRMLEHLAVERALTEAVERADGHYGPSS